MRDRPLTMQMEEYFIRRLRETFRRRRERLERVQTRAEAAAYIRGVRSAIRKAFGPPPARAPLNARTTKVSELEGCRVEQVIYESVPGFQVTANLYLPAGVSAGAGGWPAVLFPCGHSAEGKALPRYAGACVRLARTGYVVLIYDPINQGERDLYSLIETAGRPTRSNPCTGHNIIGKQMGAVGEWFGAWRLRDGIRGVDYLCTRPEVDAARLGVMGQSGGGTLSAYLWANEPRLGMVASSCWTTSYLNDIENGMPADEEQYPPGWLAAGLDKIDLFISRAGDPALLLGTENDFFDNRGLAAGYRELRRIHRLMGGRPDRCRLSFSPGQHSLNDQAQTTAIGFFNRVCGNRRPVAGVPEAVPAEPELLATPSGDVNRNGSTPVYVAVAAAARRMAAGRKAPPSVRLPDTVRRALRFSPPRRAPAHRRTFYVADWREKPRQRVFRFLVESEPGILCPLRQVQPEDYNYYRPHVLREERLYVPHICGRADLEDPSTLAGHEHFFVIEPRGLGEGLKSDADVHGPYGHEYMRAGHAALCGETLLGMRVFDVLSAVRLLRAEGAARLHLHGRGMGGVTAMLAALFEPTVMSVEATETPESFLALVTVPLSDWPAVCFPRDVLRHFDLPDVRRALGRRLTEGAFADPARCPR